MPLDDQSLNDIISYASSLSKDAGADHLKNLLGDSPQALEFISSFNSWRPDVAATKSTDASEERTAVPRKKPRKKGNPNLHTAGPVRRPENYGDVGGGYTKSTAQDYKPGTPRPENARETTSQIPRPAQDAPTVAVFPPQQRASESEPQSSYTPPNLSDLPNIKSKTLRVAPKKGGAPFRTNASTAVSANINDLSAAISALEVSTNPALAVESRVCGCNASIHPLFETAPNCLSCGKIICALEGLQPCSFCKIPILAKDQVQSMIRALKEERGQERMSTHNAAVSRSGSGTPRIGSAGRTPEDSGDESSRAAKEAVLHRDRLLAFQRDNAQRTRVHDEAADFEMTITPGMTQWMSPLQRAAALKKQQQYLRELEEANKPEWEKKKTVLSMSFKGGKVFSTYQNVKKPSVTKEDEGEGQSSKAIAGSSQPATATEEGKTGGLKLSRNPLLAGGGLIGPVWKRADSADNKGKEEQGPERQSVWRRVQDDNDDNEHWILDGGFRGFEDGSRQECG